MINTAYSLHALNIAGLDTYNAKESISLINKALEEAKRHLLYLPLPQFESPITKAFIGSSCELKALIEDEVHDVLDHLDYNGLHPLSALVEHLQTSDQPHLHLNKIVFDSEKDAEKRGSSCVGLSLAVKKRIEEKFSIQGKISVARVQKSILTPFEHASLLYRCQDGWVLIEPSNQKQSRVCAIAFDKPLHDGDVTVECMSLQVNCLDPLIQTVFHKKKAALLTYDNVKNQDNLVMSHYALRRAMFPVVVYKDGTPVKVIKVFSNPFAVVFQLGFGKDSAKRGTFDKANIQEPAFLQALEKFMQNDFHSSVQGIYLQIKQIAQGSEDLQTFYDKISVPLET